MFKKVIKKKISIINQPKVTILNDSKLISKDNTYKSVSELNSAIKKTVEGQYEKIIKVSGELSNFKISNKNLYATMKDNDSCINIVYWGYSNRNKIQYNNGENVKVVGKLAVYIKKGSYCLSLSQIEKSGSGNVHSHYELLKQKFSDLGYFTNKKKIPENITKLGIITALEGAALQDILYVLKKNNFTGKVFIKGCMVQGNQSVNSIVKGIEYLDEYIDNDGKCIDLILITRGGGSFEDLISYSSEEVVEAIHKCSKFTISAVGHEIDFMLSDFVADMRAPTPSISAELICKSQNQYVENFKTIKHKITTLMALQIKSKLESHMNQLQLIKHQLEDSLNSNNKILENEKLINLIRSGIYNKMKKKINLLNHDLVFIKRELDKYDIIGHMDDGYAVILKKYSIIDSVDNIKIGQKLKIKMKDGELNVIVI